MRPWTGPIEKDTPLKLPALRAAAEDAPCIFTVEGVCRGRNDTVVLCHSNQAIHGKSKGRKAHDCCSVFGCFECHEWYDGPLPDGMTTDERERIFDLARTRQDLYLHRNNLLRVTFKS
jgi:hypothetical protein